MEGVERYKVRLLPHNSEWEKEFLEVKEQLLACCESNILDIQHVGSTSINNICAKPILDVAVKLKSIHDLDVEKIVRLGYSYSGVRHENPNYHLFVLRGENEISLRHIHCYDQRDEEFELLVGFRDYLNAHSEIADQYNSLKRDLAQKYPDNRAAYTDAKEAFILSVYEKMNMRRGKQ